MNGRQGKIQFDYSNEQHVALIKAMGSKNKTVAKEAQEIFAMLMGPTVGKLLNLAGTSGLIYQDFPFNEDDDPSLPMDLYRNTDEGHITVWSQHMAGGLPTSEVRGTEEMKFSTYVLDTAVSLMGKYARKARLPVVAKLLERGAQEVLNKREINSWIVILTALAQASHADKSTDPVTVRDGFITSTTQDVFIPHDLNRLFTLIRRINSAWQGGTPMESFGLTDLAISPEIMESVRGFAYNPVNSIAADGTAPGQASDGIPLDDQTRRSIYQSVGTNSIFGVNLLEMLELGIGGKYTNYFIDMAPAGITHGGGNFDTTDELVIGFDLGRDSFIRPIARNSENGSFFTFQVDDQFNSRQDRIGWYGSVEEGAVCIDSRAVAAIIV